MTSVEAQAVAVLNAALCASTASPGAAAGHEKEPCALKILQLADELGVQQLAEACVKAVRVQLSKVCASSLVGNCIWVQLLTMHRHVHTVSLYVTRDEALSIMQCHGARHLKRMFELVFMIHRPHDTTVCCT